MTKDLVFKQIKGKLIVSCQALESEPLHSSYIMSRMAYAAKLGGACGIRANTVEDILEIKKTVDLPIIGIIKRVFNDSNVFITPTMEEIDKLAAINCEIIALDATLRHRHNGEKLDEIFKIARKKYPNQLFMADCAAFEECKHAQELGFDFVGTTLCSYTEDTKGTSIPNYELIKKLSNELDTPVIAEGGIWTPEQLKKVFESGAFSAVVGTAITRPMDITKRFVSILNK